MGQAVVDLPDPLEQQPGSASSADDLLSQLAGDEIDRLLTEANVDETAATAADESVDAAPSVARSHDAGAESTKHDDGSPVSHVTEPSQVAATHPREEGATPATEPAPIDAAALDQVLTNSAIAAPPAEPLPKIDIDQTLAAEADAKLAPHTADLDVDAAARHAEPADHAAEERDGLLSTMAAESTDEDLDAPLPLWLRPLEWLNAPMEMLSDEIRVILGKIAILTLVNSAAVIAYVLMFRRH